jgi:hypothetical protein
MVIFLSDSVRYPVFCDLQNHFDENLKRLADVQFTVMDFSLILGFPGTLGLG